MTPWGWEEKNRANKEIATIPNASIANLGVDLEKLLEHLTFYRSLEVKTLCQEGMDSDSNQFYMVFSGECEIFKTKNEFMVFNEDGEDPQVPAGNMNNSTIGFQSEKNQSPMNIPGGVSSQMGTDNQEEEKQKVVT